jgi:circadian clock protein KaiB
MNHTTREGSGTYAMADVTPHQARVDTRPGAAMTAAAETLMAKEPTADDPEYVLRLFVTGVTPCSQRAIDNLRKICERYLAGRYRMEVVDLYQSPGLAHDEQIVAIPTLLKVQPFPPRRVIGDLSQIDKVLRGLDIK